MANQATLLKVVCTGVFLFIATACSQAVSPAVEVPVDPIAGLYQISESGKAFAMQTKKDMRNTFCLMERDRSAFGYMLAEGRYGRSSGCRMTRAPRDGNRIAGEIQCGADRKLATGTNRFVYTGAVREDSALVSVQFKIEAKINADALPEKEAAQVRLAAQALEMMRFNIEANRIGDCL